ncbi:MAG: ATP-dependent sacrificial sulfur transferase LarE [Lachnospiraceae bacterium]|nr:ATP-dependent sacrificial sulfur transferase LarE [Lachnospiraceae bacterium]
MTDRIRGSLDKDVYGKLEKLKEYIRDLGSLAVGFSGGVDSALLLAVAKEVLDERVIAVTGSDASFPEREMKEAAAFCEEHGIRQIVCRIDPLQIAEYRNNHPDRCYHCKHRLFSEIKRVAAENGIAHVAEGSNMDDLGDYRPGLQAVEELGVKSPFRQALLYKDEIRQISKAMGLPTWNKPAYACLASRFVYGEEITEEKLHMIDRAEQFLIAQGFREERVRMHGKIARIEVPEKDIPRLASDELRNKVYDAFKEIGFQFVTLDLKGYRTGSMNATIGISSGKGEETWI